MATRCAGLVLLAVATTVAAGAPLPIRSHALAALHDADPTWNSGAPSGLVSTAQIYIAALAINPDGSRFLVGSQMSSIVAPIVTRLKADGSLDTTFGTNGTLQLQAPPSPPQLLGELSDAAIQPGTGRLVVVGPNGATINVIRLDAVGAPDTTFGNGGLMAINGVGGSTHLIAPRLHMLPTGEILLVTFSADAQGLFSLSIIKLDANGGLEQGFGVGGMATMPLSNQPLNTVGRLGAVAVDSLGRIVASGTSPSNQSMVARWTATGVPDESFAAHGAALDPFQISSCGDDATIDALDRIVVVCPYSDRPFGVNPIARIRRYLPNGRLDDSFGLDGVASVPPAGLHTFSVAKHVAMQGDKIVVGGQISETDQSLGFADSALWRFTGDGQLDRSFGASGGIIRDHVGRSDAVDLMAVLPDGRISTVVNASTGDFTQPQVFSFQYRPETAPAEPSLNTIVNPRRVLDTRIGIGAPVGQVERRRDLKLTVVGGEVPTDAVAVLLNVTVTEPDSAGYLTVYACGPPPPVASNVNFIAAQTIPNAVIARVDSNGQICFFSSARTHLVADITGWYGPNTDLLPLDLPTRMIDTRIGLGKFGPLDTAKIGGDRLAKLWPPAMQLDRPYLDELVMNVTVTEPDTDGYLTVYPCDKPRPVASNLNFTKGQTIANLVVSRATTAKPFYPDGSVCFYSNTLTHIVVDVLATLNEGAAHRAVATPTRLLDTRIGQGAQQGLLSAFEVLTLHVAGVAGVASNAPAIALNVTVTEPATAGYLTVFPCGQPVPVTSNLNFSPGETIANLVVARIGASGDLCFLSNTTTHLVADLAEWYPAVS